jgi:iron complex transport system substrate-binding protein
MPASALLLAGSAAVRAASLNLCTDEYLLLLAKPQQIVGVSYLSRELLESPLAEQARRYPGNGGSIEDVLTLRPNLVLTMGGGGRATALLARRLHLHAVDLPAPATLDDVAKNLRTVAMALGNPRAADSWVHRLAQLRRTFPGRATDSFWVSGGGQSLAPGSLAAEWLRLAGFQQRPLANGRVTLETLLTSPPKVLIRSDYRSGQMSGGQRWLKHPVVRRAASRQLVTDGRPWTCQGPLMIPEVERLRKAAK